MASARDGSAWAAAAAAAVRPALLAGRCEANAEAMARYMRDQFPFLGLRMAAVTNAWAHVRRAVTAELGTPTGDDLVTFAEDMWLLPEREYQYVGAKALALASRRRDRGGLGPEHLDRVGDLITTKSWWDTVDILAPNVVGALARASPRDVVPVLDRWIADEDVWLVRTALLHQLRWKEATDRERLGRHCLTAAPRTEFFVRKAIGWALRSYSYVAPGWVEAFVARHADDLGGLSRREALKVIARRRP